MLANADIWSREHNIAREDANTLTVAEFREKYELPCIPVVLTNVVNTWPAWKLGLWTPGTLRMTFAELQRHMADRVNKAADAKEAQELQEAAARVAPGACERTLYACGVTEMSIEKYLTYAERVQHEDSPLCKH